MTETSLNQIKKFPINNITDISQFILFLVKGEIYPPNQLVDKVYSLHNEILDIGISNFLNNINHFHPYILEKLKESVFLTKRIYEINRRFPPRFANGNKEIFYSVMSYLVKLSSRIQEYIYNKYDLKIKNIETPTELFEEMKRYEKIEEYKQNLTEIIINLLLNSTKLNPIKND